MPATTAAGSARSQRERLTPSHVRPARTAYRPALPSVATVNGPKEFRSGEPGSSAGSMIIGVGQTMSCTYSNADSTELGTASMSSSAFARSCRATGTASPSAAPAISHRSRLRINSEWHAAAQHVGEHAKVADQAVKRVPERRGAVALDREMAEPRERVAEAAVGHHRLLAGIEAGLAGEVLRGVRLGAAGLAGVVERGRLVDHQVRRLERHPVRGERMLDRLIPADGPVEHHPLLRIRG